MYVYLKEECSYDKTFYTFTYVAYHATYMKKTGIGIMVICKGRFKISLNKKMFGQIKSINTNSWKCYSDSIGVGWKPGGGEQWGKNGWYLSYSQQ